MNQLLQEAFERASELPEEEQDRFARFLLAEPKVADANTVQMPMVRHAQEVGLSVPYCELLVGRYCYDDSSSVGLY